MKTKLLLLICVLTFTACRSTKSSQDDDNGRVLFVNAYTKPCNAGVMTKNCLLVKWDSTAGDWTYFYNEIEGFTYQKGYVYKLLIHEEPVQNPPADASSMHYSLLKIVSKTPVEKS